MSDLAFFVDISSHQTVEDWDLLARSTDGIIIKASQGENFRDPNLEANVAAARAAGLPVMALYHYANHVGSGKFSKRISSPVEAALNLLGACREHGVKWGVLDLEPKAVKDALAAGMTADDLEDWVKRFFLTWFQNDSLRLCVYLSGHTIKRAKGGFDFLRDFGLPLWWAGYIGPYTERSTRWPEKPVGWLRGWPNGMTQYRGGDDRKTVENEGGLCPGIKGDVDTNCGPTAGTAGEMIRDAKLA